MPKAIEKKCICENPNCSEMICEQCGCVLHITDNYCPNCGGKIVWG